MRGPSPSGYSGARLAPSPTSPTMSPRSPTTCTARSSPTCFNPTPTSRRRRAARSRSRCAAPLHIRATRGGLLTRPWSRTQWTNWAQIIDTYLACAALLRHAVCGLGMRGEVRWIETFCTRVLRAVRRGFTCMRIVPFVLVIREGRDEGEHEAVCLYCSGTVCVVWSYSGYNIEVGLSVEFHVQSPADRRTLVAKSLSACHAPRRRESPCGSAFGLITQPPAREGGARDGDSKTVIELLCIGLFLHHVICLLMSAMRRIALVHVYL